MALWHMYGVNVVEMYGQTETAGGIVSGQRGPFPAPGNVGAPPSGWNVRLAEDGEVLVHSADLFEGYWRNDEATRAVKTADGWLRTGDIGEWRRTRSAAARRPRARLHRDRGRQDLVALVHRECAARVAVCRRGRRVRPRPQICLRPRRDRLRYGCGLGARPRRHLYGLHQSRAEPAGAAADPDRDRQGQRAARPRRADQGVPYPAQDARSRRKKASRSRRPARSSAP